MRPVLRLRQLAVQRTWCRPLLSRRTTATVTVQLLDAEAMRSPSLNDDGVAGPSNAASTSSAAAGPSRIPFESAPIPSSPPSGQRQTRSKSILARPVLEPSESLGRYGSERYNVERLQLHIDTLKTAVIPWITKQRAAQTWSRYRDLTPATRRSLPHAVHRAVLRQVVPAIIAANTELDYSGTLLDAQARFREQWAQRVHFVVDEMANTDTGLFAADAKIAIERLASFGDVQGAERVYAQFLRQKNAILPAQRNALAVARLHALLKWYEGVLLLRSHPPQKAEQFWSSAAAADSDFNAKVERGIPERDLAAQPKADLVLGVVWSILDDFISARSTPNAASINTVVMALDQTRQVYHQKEFAPALDDMMERVITIAYGIDLAYLRMQDAVADRVNTLKGLHKEAAQVLLNWLLRRSEVWRGVALLELLDSGHWKGIVENELYKAKPKAKQKRGETMDKGKERDDGFGPTLAEATAAFADANQDVDMFGRHKTASPDSATEIALSSNLPSPLSLVSLPKKSKVQPRTYADFYPAEIPLPSRIPYGRVAQQANTGPNAFSKTPFSTAYRNVDGRTYRTAIASARDAGDLDAVIHFSRMFMERAVQQQTYWLQRVFTEQHRLALSKTWREENQMVKYQRDVQAKQDALAQRRAAYIAQARAEGSQLSDELLERAAQKIHRARRLAPPPPSETVWPQDLLPPRILFSFTTLKLVKSRVKALPHAHAQLQEAIGMIAQAAHRVYEEHVVLSGRKPTGSRLTDKEYASMMRQEGVEVLNDHAPMAAYFGTESQAPRPADRLGFQPLAYLARLNRTHASLVDLLDDSLMEKYTMAQRRSRKNRGAESRRRGEEQQLYEEEIEAELEAEQERDAAKDEAWWA